MPKKQIDLHCIQGVAKTTYDQLDFYSDTPKQTGTGLHFCSYYGLRMYLITGKKEGRFLQGSCHENDGTKYEYVPDLIKQLEDALRLNLSRYPLMISMLKKAKPEFIWSAFGIRDCEEEWVNIVRTVVSTL